MELRKDEDISVLKAKQNWVSKQSNADGIEIYIPYTNLPFSSNFKMGHHFIVCNHAIKGI